MILAATLVGLATGAAATFAVCLPWRRQRDGWRAVARAADPTQALLDDIHGGL